jgi:hypothetical protein
LREFLLDYGHAYLPEELDLFWKRFDKKRESKIDYQEFSKEFNLKADKIFKTRFDDDGK